MTKKRFEANHNNPNQSPPTLETDVMTASETAFLLKVNVKTIYEECKAGTIPHSRIGKQLRFSKRAVLQSLCG